MLRWLVLTQAVIYLLVMPALHAATELGYKPPLLIGVVAVVALILGGFVPPLARHHAEQGAVLPHLQPRSWFAGAWVVLAIAYAIIAVRYGLLNRRQGSEYMAELYATLPLQVLALLRIYELLLIPVLLLYTFGAGARQGRQRLAILLATIASLPFMGLADSRGRLLVMGIYLLSFVTVERFITYFYRNWRIVAGGIVVITTFIVVSVKRAGSYSSLSDYLFMEVYSRLDGLNLVTQLQDTNQLSYWGKFDLGMINPLLSKVPFLEAAKAAKMMGKTSTKQYIIQDVIGSMKLDDSNSMITDPMYFGGLIGVVFAFFALGLAMRRFDQFIADRKLLVNFWPSALALTFATSVAIFENDFMGALANIPQVLPLIAIFLALCTKREALSGLGNTLRNYGDSTGSLKGEAMPEAVQRG